MYRLLAKLLPRKVRKVYGRLMDYSNIDINADKFVGFVLFFGIGIALAFTFYFGRSLSWNPWILFFSIFLGIELLIYFWLVMSADAKARFVEKILPDALQLMSSNLKAGMTVDRALLLSARPEFGALQDELNIVGKEIATGTEVGDALLGLSKRIKSARLEKTVLLIVAGLKSGGKLAALLEQVSKNLRQQISTEEKAKSSIMMYVIFISTAIIFASPLLFALGSYLAEVIGSITAGIDIPQSNQMDLPFAFSQANVSIEFIVNFSITFLVTNCILGSFIIALINKGKEKYGVKTIPIFVIISLIVFFLIRKGISGMLEGLFAFA